MADVMFRHQRTAFDTFWPRQNVRYFADILLNETIWISERMMVSLLTQICLTRPQGVKASIFHGKFEQYLPIDRSVSRSISHSRPPRDYNLLPPINHWNSGPISLPIITQSPLQWRHNEPDGVSNHQPHDCLLNRLFRRRSKKTLKLCVTGLCEGNLPVTGDFPAQRSSNTENVSIWWRHHAIEYFLCSHPAYDKGIATFCTQRANKTVVIVYAKARIDSHPIAGIRLTKTIEFLITSDKIVGE